MRRIAFVVSLFLVAILPARAQEGLQPGRLEGRFRAVAEQVRPSSVAILGLVGMGSGVIIDRSGLVLTNAHVALAAPHCAVVFPDGRRVLARRAGIYFPRDLALIQLPEGDYPAVEPAPIGSLKTGDWVVAYGHPGGLKPDVQPAFSAGQVTGSVPGGVAVMGLLNYEGGVETDLAIYSGNSGGPLFDLQGRLVGINGAVNRLSGASFTLGLDIIASVLPRLTGGRIWLSDEMVFDPADERLRSLFELYEPLSRQAAENWIQNGWPGEKMPGAVVRERSGLEGILQRVLDTLDPPAEHDAPLELVQGRHGEARQKALAAAFQPVFARAAARTVRLEAGGRLLGLGTVVAPGWVVTKASLLGDGADVEVALGGRESIPARRVAESDEHDLALLRADGLRAPGEDAAGAPDVGSWALVPDAGGKPLAVGVVSARLRPIPAGQTSLLPEGLQRIVQLGVIRAFRNAPAGSEMRQLAEQMEMLEQSRKMFESGNEPRNYPSVLQHDAPVDPHRVGGPVLDREGRLLGVNVGRAHHGTTYAVPIEVVRKAFPQVGGR